MLNRYLLSLLILVLPSFCFTQKNLKIDCCKIDLVIPEFDESSLLSLNNQFAVKAKIASPISSSPSPIEIRINRTFPGAGNVLIIKCIKDSLIAERYDWIDRTSKANIKTSSDGSGIAYAGLKYHHLSLPKSISWNVFFKGLIEDHLFSIPGKDWLNIEVLKSNKNISFVGEGGYQVWEIKVNDSFRVVEFNTEYFPEPIEVKDYIYLQELLKKFDKLSVN